VSTLLLLQIMQLLLLTRMIPSLTRPLALQLDHRRNVAWLFGLPQIASIQEIAKVAEPLLGQWLGSTDLEQMGRICQEVGLQWASPDPRLAPWRAQSLAQPGDSQGRAESDGEATREHGGSTAMPLYDSNAAWDPNSASSLQGEWYSDSITGAAAAPAQSKPAQSQTVSASQRRVISCTRCGTSVLSKSKKQARCGCGYHALFTCTVCPEGSPSFTRCVC
jgi:hypothetical protein